MTFTYLRQIKRFSLAILMAMAFTVAACSGDSECDSCSSDSDCDSGQFCASTTMGERCLKNGETSCGVDITQL